jgi:hypothetical protein
MSETPPGLQGCPSCGRPNPDYRRTCWGCGAGLPVQAADPPAERIPPATVRPPTSVGVSTAQLGVPGEVGKPNERVLYRWPAPHGRGLLTDQRCLLLGHPHPLRRDAEWEQELENIRHLIARELRDARAHDHHLCDTIEGGPTMAGGSGDYSVDVQYELVVDDVTVFVGTPFGCEELQRRIDAARAERCLAVYGRVLPYGPAVEEAGTVARSPNGLDGARGPRG